jgi:hypothetical protein
LIAEPARVVVGVPTCLVVATSLSHLAVHNPIPKWHGLISGVAFPYSPPEIDRGPVYEFHLNHVLVPDSPTALFRTEYEEV